MSLKFLDWIPDEKTLDDKASDFSTFFLVSDIIKVINEVTRESKSLVTMIASTIAKAQRWGRNGNKSLLLSLLCSLLRRRMSHLCEPVCNTKHLIIANAKKTTNMCLFAFKLFVITNKDLFLLLKL